MTSTTASIASEKEIEERAEEEVCMEIYTKLENWIFLTLSHIRIRFFFKILEKSERNIFNMSIKKYIWHHAWIQV